MIQAVQTRTARGSFVIDIAVDGNSVRQKIRSEDWSLRTDTPIGGQAFFPLRHLRPDTAVLNALVSDRYFSANPEWRLHIFGFHLRPEKLLTVRAIRQRDVRQMLRRPIDDVIKQSLPLSASDVDLRDAVMQALVAGASLPSLTTERLNALIAEVAREHEKSANRHLGVQDSDLERTWLHRVRQLLLRRLDNDKNALRALALHYIAEGDRLVDSANRRTLDALRLRPDVSDAEARAFEFFYCRAPALVNGRTPFYDGILGYQTFLMSLLRLSGTLAGLIVTRFFDVIDQQQRPQFEEGLRRQMVALVRTGSCVVDMMRSEEKIVVRERRERRGVAPKSRPMMIKAVGLLPHIKRLTSRQHAVVEPLANGASATEVAADLGITRQAVQNTLRHAGERARKPKRVQAALKSG